MGAPFRYSFAAAFFVLKDQKLDIPAFSVP